MGGACDTCGREEMCIEVFVRKPTRKRPPERLRCG